MDHCLANTPKYFYKLSKAILQYIQEVLTGAQDFFCVMAHCLANIPKCFYKLSKAILQYIQEVLTGSHLLDLMT